METVYLALGSNLGDRAGNIAKAIAALSARGIRVTKRSALYETEPVNARGGWFLNAAVEVETDLPPDELMGVLLDAERSLGRRRESISAGDGKTTAAAALKDERAIDIDIVLFGSRIIQTAHLEIPHPRMAGRRFVLAPLAEIAPHVEHPLLKKTMAELLASTPDRSEVQPRVGPGGA